jgi:hypothetical protein
MAISVGELLTKNEDKVPKNLFSVIKYFAVKVESLELKKVLYLF